MIRIICIASLFLFVTLSQAVTTGQRLKALAGTGKNTKVVWARSNPGWDMGYTTFPNAKCVLMGMDAAKGTEDTLCKTVTNYTRPLITSDGERIIYTNSVDTAVHIMNWDGSKDQIITKGMAGCLWADAVNKKEYVVCVKDCFLECKENIVLININDTNEVITILTPVVNTIPFYFRVHPHLLSISSDGKTLCLDYLSSSSASLQALINLSTKKIISGPNGALVGFSGTWPSIPYDTTARMIFFNTGVRDSLAVLTKTSLKSIPLSFCNPGEDCAVGHFKMSGSNPRLATYIVGGLNLGKVVVAKIDSSYTVITDTITVSTLAQDGYPEVWTTPTAFISGSPTSIKAGHATSSETIVCAVPGIWRHSSVATITLPRSTNIHAVLYTYDGRVAWRMDAMADAGENRIKIDAHSVTAGRYLLSVNAGGQRFVRPLLMTRGK